MLMLQRLTKCPEGDREGDAGRKKDPQLEEDNVGAAEGV
jgi:hypothetical protein